MKVAPYLGKPELIRLIRELAEVAFPRGKLRRELKAVLKEADRQDRERKRKALVAKSRRESRAKERRRIWREEEVKRRAERERWDRESLEIRRRQEARHAAWKKRYGDHNIETIFGIPVKLEPEAAIPAPFPT